MLSPQSSGQDLFCEFDRWRRNIAGNPLHFDRTDAFELSPNRSELSELQQVVFRFVLQSRLSVLFLEVYQLAA